MTGDTVFEPYACRLQFVSDIQLEPQKWQYSIETFMKHFAREGIEKGPCFIGHIKGFVDTSDAGYLKFSLVDAKRPVNITGGLKVSLQSISMDLNAHIYMIKSETIE